MGNLLVTAYMNPEYELYFNKSNTGPSYPLQSPREVVMANVNVGAMVEGTDKTSRVATTLTRNAPRPSHKW